MGFSKKGTRCHETRSGLSSRPMSHYTISWQKTMKIIMPIPFESCCNRSVFEKLVNFIRIIISEVKPMKDLINKLSLFKPDNSFDDLFLEVNPV